MGPRPVRRRTFTSHSTDDTARFAAECARDISPGLCIALEGDLGAGKTTFTRALVEALGGDANAVSSPTFMLLNIYSTPRMNVYHLDAYRVHGSDDFEAIGFSELLEQNGLVLVEWPSRVNDLLPTSTVTIQIRSIGESSRVFEIT